MGDVFPWKDGAFLTGAWSGRTGVYLWKPPDHAMPVMEAKDDSVGYGAFSTDGVDAVWVMGKGGVSPSSPGGMYEWNQQDLYTAKTSAVAAGPWPFTGGVRLRSLAFGSAITWTVGCGYAARMEWDYGSQEWFNVVRLSDGRGWKVFGKNGGQLNGHVTAITCEWLHYNDGNGVQTRFRLDELGPGTPAD